MRDQDASAKGHKGVAGEKGEGSAAAAAGGGASVVASVAGRSALPPLLEAARVSRYEGQYNNPNTRENALLNSLCVACEAYLARAGVSVSTGGSGHMRILRLLTETHVQGQRNAGRGGHQDPASLALGSTLQLAEFMAMEYVSGFKGCVVRYEHTVPVAAFRPVKRRRRREPPAVKSFAFCGELSRKGPSAFHSVSKRTPFNNDDEVVPESEYEDSDEGEESSDDEYEDCLANIGGTPPAAQCQCHACVLGGGLKVKG